MLDRKIPFYNVILRCGHYKTKDVILPEGYCIAGYEPGYEKEWARLECAVGDFSSEEEAEVYFATVYMQDKEKLMKNARFLLDKEKKVVGACMAWKDLRQGKWVSSLHWMIVEEKHQGLGLGRALCTEIMNLFEEQNRLPVYIHTQPWSWKAILLYISLGFRIQKEDTFSNYKNEYVQAMKTLQTVVNDSQFSMLLEASEMGMQL